MSQKRTAMLEKIFDNIKVSVMIKLYAPYLWLDAVIVVFPWVVTQSRRPQQLRTYNEVINEFAIMTDHTYLYQKQKCKVSSPDSTLPEYRFKPVPLKFRKRLGRFNAQYVVEFDIVR